MKFIPRLVLLSSLASSLCFGGERLNSARNFFTDIDPEISRIPAVYQEQLQSESKKAEERIDERLNSFDYLLEKSQDPFWNQERDYFYEQDIEKAEELSRDILKDSLRESEESLYVLNELTTQVRGFFLQKLQIKVEPRAKQETRDLPPEAEYNLRKKSLKDEEAVTVKPEDKKFKRIIYKTFGSQAGFKGGFDLNSLDEVESFLKLDNPNLFGSRFTDFRIGYCLGTSDSYLKAELEKELGRGVYLKLEAEQSINSEYEYGISIQRGLREHDSVSLGISSSSENNAYLGLEYRAILPCNPIKDIQRFFMNKK